MHNIHDIKSIFNQNVFISKMQCEMGHLKYTILSYKPMQKMTRVMCDCKKTFTLAPKLL
jgi:hypothetical protein